ncbi:MAG: hypothetical protein ACRD2E_04310 [Terriglobales bacterium]
MSGQPPNSAIVPLPGGARAYELNGGWLEVRGDWLRTPWLTTPTATVPPDPPVGTDIWHSGAGCPGCGQLWQNTGNVVDGLWYGTLAVGSAGLGDVLEGAAASTALVLNNWQTALELTLYTSPAVVQGTQLGQDFLAGWNGWPSTINPNWVNAMGAEAHRIVQCPPWGSCG